MKSSRLIDLLKTLKISEIDTFKTYLEADLHNKRPKLRLLFAYIYGFAPSFDARDFTKAGAAQAVFGKKDISKPVLNNLLSDLLQILYNFLAFQQFQKKQSLQQQLLVEDLLQRNAHKFALQQIKKLDKQQSNFAYQNAAFHQRHYQLAEKKDQLFLQTVRRGFDENLQNMSEHFDWYYMNTALKMACEMASRNVVIQAQYDYSFFERCFVFFSQEKKWESQPSLQIYYKVFRLITQEQAENIYQELRPLVQQYAYCLSPTELTDIYGYILNYCIRQINLGKTAYNSEVFEWYKILLKEDILLENNQLSENNYRNIITASLRSKAYTWAENFIHEYKSYLKKNVRENAVAFNLAALFFEKKEYSKALIQLFNVNFTDNFYHILSSTIQLKCYFHLQETEAYLALIQALRQYIQRNKNLSTYHKTTNLNFLRLAKQIYQLQLAKELLPKQTWSKKQQTLREKLQQTQPITNKEWLEAVIQ